MNMMVFVSTSKRLVLCMKILCSNYDQKFMENLRSACVINIPQSETLKMKQPDGFFMIIMTSGHSEIGRKVKLKIFIEFVLIELHKQHYISKHGKKSKKF